MKDSFTFKHPTVIRVKESILAWILIPFLMVFFTLFLPAKTLAIISDDFNAGALDTGLWSIVDPVGDGAVVVNGTQALISVPAGTSHDVWSSGNFAPRVMQAAADTDIALKYGNQIYQCQPIGNWLMMIPPM